jgi:uncharacterized protein
LANIPLPELLWLAAALLAAGAVTGVMAGLFGVGGGTIMVPVLYEVFRVLSVPEEVRMALCVGTSLAVIIPTSIRSFRAHLTKNAVDMTVLRLWAVPVVLGVTFGSVIAGFAPSWLFKLVFIAVASLIAIKMLFGKASWRFKGDLPTGPLMRVYGVVIGLLSALMGIGGGALSNMLMSFHGRAIHQSVATSSGLGVLISIPGALGYMWAGWGKAGLPPLSLGFVSVIGFLLLIPTTIYTAPLGVKLAHSLPRRTLEIAFGVFLSLVSLRFILAMVF